MLVKFIMFFLLTAVEKDHAWVRNIKHLTFTVKSKELGRFQPDIQSHDCISSEMHSDFHCVFTILRPPSPRQHEDYIKDGSLVITDLHIISLAFIVKVIRLTCSNQYLYIAFNLTNIPWLHYFWNSLHFHAYSKQRRPLSHFNIKAQWSLQFLTTNFQKNNFHQNIAILLEERINA